MKKYFGGKMNITYIIGNGLDIQYGLKTKYKNFYEFQNEIYQRRKRMKTIPILFTKLFSRIKWMIMRTGQTLN